MAKGEENKENKKDEQQAQDDGLVKCPAKVKKVMAEAVQGSKVEVEQEAVLAMAKAAELLLGELAGHAVGAAGKRTAAAAAGGSAKKGGGGAPALAYADVATAVRADKKYDFLE
eukprot:CAMPEP_0202858922 /NCGR_PEP_ID=MMETSP1391-20130828/1256_1 /ASSEMBLY_ACC=CAM_ASM_000867 /TAXON_ID=1034604 /ORGANISM="Chlamydomonas leiostraca, Strain SAG 11-49" /LENGTH=113 /DNA_ID=CAMNT_0049537901 /DNA_START=92 /DNA_END=430 /DNA_ORIENTATION=+